MSIGQIAARLAQAVLDLTDVAAFEGNLAAEGVCRPPLS